MEPNILLLGRGMDSLNILKDELLKFDRKIVCANSNELISAILLDEQVDLVIVGAGLPDDMKNEMVALVKSVGPELLVHIMERKPGMNPTSMIGYTNEKAVMWKLMRARKAT